jgi:hypothetical protein
MHFFGPDSGLAIGGKKTAGSRSATSKLVGTGARLVSWASTGAHIRSEE